MNQRPIMIMAGGTGGHIFPALAVARDLMARDIPVVWLGSRNGMEARLIPETGIPIAWMKIGGLRGKGFMTWLAAPFRLLVAMGQAFRALRHYHPRMVLGMGGFVAGPGGAMAALMRIPLVIHEQNSVSGLTNRILSRLATRVLQAFPGSFDEDLNAQTVGNPVRPEISSVALPEQRLRPSKSRLSLLVVGGSLGAQVFNELVPQAVAALAEGECPEIWHQAGEKKIEEARAAYRAAGVEARVEPFIEDMAAAYTWADLVICRAGALTVSELAAAGVASILVPYPYAVDDHQTGNARYLSEAGAAILMPQASMTPASLTEQLIDLMKHRERLISMAQKAHAQARPDATRQVADICLQVGGAS
jgi:UDP-N-acetylglucosamine--N-acetylmuramyl-(pentapeptide) pyrophosphoryl-undecaprenol N-acetylglucosamine transferase